MDSKRLSLDSSADVKRFTVLYQRWIDNQYPQKRIREMNLAYFSDFCRMYQDGGRVFNALLDIFINFELIFADWKEMQKIGEEGPFYKGAEEKPIIEDEALFFATCTLHRYATAFIFRYRAMYDKLMGLAVLLVNPEEYHRSFKRAKSKKSAFSSALKNFVESSPDFSQEDLDKFLADLTTFDDKYRTSEVHGFGTLRSTLFVVGDQPLDIVTDLMGYYNRLNRFLNSILTWLHKSFDTFMDDLVNGRTDTGEITSTT